mmetsp:Transcript_19525/g.52059  ORF Transcript_19525/g.52059 Transcript_19525/m.52059 type:complete len:224 (-) Transcript_19525:120-791(-)
MCHSLRASTPTRPTYSFTHVSRRGCPPLWSPFSWALSSPRIKCMRCRPLRSESCYRLIRITPIPLRRPARSSATGPSSAGVSTQPSSSRGGLRHGCTASTSGPRAHPRAPTHQVCTTVLTCRTTSTLPAPSGALLMTQSLLSGCGSRPLTPISQSTTIRTARAARAPYRSTGHLTLRTWFSTTRMTPLTACIRALPVACGPSCRMRSTGRTPVWTSLPATPCL